MANIIVINSSEEETRVALLRARITTKYSRKKAGSRNVGNIYKGRCGADSTWHASGRLGYRLESDGLLVY